MDENRQAVATAMHPFAGAAGDEARARNGDLL